MSFLELKKVTKVYPNGTKAVQPTSLKIDKENLWFLLDHQAVENPLC